MKENNDDMKKVICNQIDKCKDDTCHHLTPHRVFQDVDADGGIPCTEKTECEMHIPCSMVKCIEVVAK